MGGAAGFSFDEDEARLLAKRWQEPLWPTRFRDDTPECAWRFLLELRTYIETTGEVLHFPDKEGLEAYCHLWHECKREGKMLVAEKCRRMLISWEARGLELHQLGLSRCDQLLSGEHYAGAAKHVWRLKHYYTDLQMRFPNWNLPAHGELSYEGERQLKAFSLPNGSICNYANGEVSSLQGEGTRIITLEEAALYRHLAGMVGQAKILTMGPANRPRAGVLVNLITNTPPMDAPSAQSWQQIKAGWKELPLRKDAA